VTSWRRLTVVLAVAGTLLADGCGSGPDQNNGKDEKVETKSKTDVVALARGQAEQVAQLTGGTLEQWETRSSACTGRNGEIADDGRWSLSAFAAVKLPADKHVKGLQAVHDQWQSKNWEITTFRTLPDGVRGVLDGRDPTNGLTVSLASSVGKTQLALTMGSACYQPAAGEDPANDN